MNPTRLEPTQTRSSPRSIRHVHAKRPTNGTAGRAPRRHQTSLRAFVLRSPAGTPRSRKAASDPLPGAPSNAAMHRG